MLVEVEVDNTKMVVPFLVLRHSNRRGNRQLKLTHVLALRSRANGQGNRLLKLTRALSPRSRAKRIEQTDQEAAAKICGILALRRQGTDS